MDIPAIVASLITEDPDVLAEGKCSKCGKRLTVDDGQYVNPKSGIAHCQKCGPEGLNAPNKRDKK